ncbi:MAG: hypothetical protein AAF357_16455, partial [Verrucomicrobiota bacterium]
PEVHHVQVPILAGKIAISCKNTKDLKALRAEIVRVSTSKKKDSDELLLPHVGQRIPKVWARASAVMDGLKNGTDLLDSAGLGEPRLKARKGQKQLRFPAQNYVSETELSNRWDDVVQTLGLQSEVGGKQDSSLDVSILPEIDGCTNSHQNKSVQVGVLITATVR